MHFLDQTSIHLCVTAFSTIAWDDLGGCSPQSRQDSLISQVKMKPACGNALHATPIPSVDISGGIPLNTTAFIVIGLSLKVFSTLAQLQAPTLRTAPHKLQ